MLLYSQILSPFFLRRVKSDVDIGLPPKREVFVYTPMTPLQVELYEATLTMNYDHFALRVSEWDMFFWEGYGNHSFCLFMLKSPL